MIVDYKIGVTDQRQLYTLIDTYSPIPFQLYLTVIRHHIVARGFGTETFQSAGAGKRRGQQNLA
jgi:hypothetical protein